MLSLVAIMLLFSTIILSLSNAQTTTTCNNDEEETSSSSSSYYNSNVPYRDRKTIRSDMKENLKLKTQTELEQICTNRGFEIIDDEYDEITGKPIASTKDDYVEAAIQCISMSDMAFEDFSSNKNEQQQRQRTSNPHNNKDIAIDNKDNNNNIDRRQRQEPLLQRLLKEIFGRALIKAIKSVRYFFVDVIGGSIVQSRISSKNNDDNNNSWQQQTDKTDNRRKRNNNYKNQDYYSSYDTNYDFQ